MIRAVNPRSTKDPHYIKGPLKKRPLRISQSDLENGAVIENHEFSFPLRSFPTVWNLLSRVKTKEDYWNEISSNNNVNCEQAASLLELSKSLTPLRRSKAVMNIPMMTRISLNVTTNSQKMGSNKNRNSVTQNTPVQCPFCSKYYTTLAGLSKHIQTHCKRRPQQQQFHSSPQQQQFHSSPQQQQRLFSCKFCEKSYLSSFALKMHSQTHSLPHKCPLCERGFSRPWLLQGHIRTHTGEKPFACHFCHRAFSDKSNLRAHMQTHAKVKKYSCNTCSKSYSRLSLLTKHMDNCNSRPH